jgi:hypothetical protein
MQNTLTEEGFAQLCENMPPLSLFAKNEGVKRAYGQAAQDRYSLHYRAGLTLPQPWQEFLAELQGEAYQSFPRNMLASESFLLTFEWHYAWQGCSVSPHCDAARKIATFTSTRKTGTRNGTDRRSFLTAGESSELTPLLDSISFK